MNNLNNTEFIILAAGLGKRMKSDLPKVMHLLHGIPLIEHVQKKVESLSIDHKPIIVVNPTHSLVQNHLGERADYVTQSEPLGTGHAVASATEILEKSNRKNVVILNGDMPYLKTESIKKMVDLHENSENILTMLTIKLPNFEEKYTPFFSFGRIVRDESGNILKIVEKKDCDEKQLEITEVNMNYFCFNREWLLKNLPKIKNENNQKEYYIVDLIKFLYDEGAKIGSMEIDYVEALGVNTPEDMEIVKNISLN